MRNRLLCFLFAAAMPLVAHADPAADVKAGNAVKDRHVDGVSDHFARGETVYVDAVITDGDGVAVEHVWKRDGKEVRRAHQTAQGKRWRTSSRYTGVSTGSYVVTILAGDKPLGEVKFKVE